MFILTNIILCQPAMIFIVFGSLNLQTIKFRTDILSGWVGIILFDALLLSYNFLLKKLILTKRKKKQMATKKHAKLIST